MPAIETANRKQKAVLWAASGHDDYGEPKVNSAVELSVRWTEGREETTDAQGEVVSYDATVRVDREIAVGSVLWKGKLADVPSPTSDLFRVVARKTVPDLKGRDFERIVFLKRLSESLPTLN